MKILTRCKIRFTQFQLQKKKSGVKKWMGISAIKGAGAGGSGPQLSINISNSNILNSTSFDLESLNAKVTSVKSTEQEWVSELGSESLTRVANDQTRVR